MSKRSNSIANKVYKFVQDKSVYIETDLVDREFENEWVKIYKNGKIKVSRDYAWDGCSPKFNFLQFMFGTPDGTINYNTEKPYSYYASLFHDVIYQFKHEITISRLEADIIFNKMLKRDKFMWWWLYYIGVRIGGAFYGKWKSKSKQTKINLGKYSWE